MATQLGVMLGSHKMGRTCQRVAAARHSWSKKALGGCLVRVEVERKERETCEVPVYREDRGGK
jgi:hypothetical protein